MTDWALWETDFDTEVREMVASQLPKLFAVVQVIGEEDDALVAAWGMRLEDGKYEVVSVTGQRRMRMSSLARVLPSFERDPEVSARVVWADPADAPAEPAVPA
ncbi:hypothetical protein RM844_17950 [Streptomyces sp. DSM 44915]|uniref:Uncharacterized protein n=1 Tax=Streptomyces chisholmiae TaxID=3075540 RepID=A0ABU2JT56_9ACTN|nr:hypothetical protein [Streptomyces sp. DSM 44915]MDT0268169.1 hypothetical protein [Streptomyces sp. DSM 44915]